MRHLNQSPSRLIWDLIRRVSAVRWMCGCVWVCVRTLWGMLCKSRDNNAGRQRLNHKEAWSLWPWGCYVKWPGSLSCYPPKDVWRPNFKIHSSSLEHFKIQKVQGHIWDKRKKLKQTWSEIYLVRGIKRKECVSSLYIKTISSCSSLWPAAVSMHGLMGKSLCPVNVTGPVSHIHKHT